MTQSTLLTKPPNTLLIHLNRITFDPATRTNTTLSTKISIPPHLYSEYDLTGIITHTESGTYSSFLRVENGGWLEVEGGEVRVHEKYDFSGEAYILVYGRREGGMVKVDVERGVI